jgi:hypothetical protein
MRLPSAWPRGVRLAVYAACALACAVQVASFVREDVARYRKFLHRERYSESLAFFRELDGEVLARVPPGAPLRIFTDSSLYLPPRPGYQVHIQWRSIEDADLRTSRADLVLLRRSELERFRDPSIVGRTLDPAQTQRSYDFYAAAREDGIPGYRRLLETDYAVAFGRVGD